MGGFRPPPLKLSDSCSFDLPDSPSPPSPTRNLLVFDESHAETRSLGIGGLRLDVSLTENEETFSPRGAHQRPSNEFRPSIKDRLQHERQPALDLVGELRHKNELEGSFEVSASGTFKASGFEINKDGITKTPVLERRRIQDESGASTEPRSSLLLPTDNTRHRSFSGGSSVGQGFGPSPTCSDISPYHPTGEVGSPTHSAVSHASFNPPSVPPSPATNSSGRGWVSDDGRVLPLRLKDLVKLRFLGKGASGSVYKTFETHPSWLCCVALKIVNVFDKEKRRQISQELKAFSRIESPYIVDFYGAYFEKGKISIALEYMDRGSLDAVVRDIGPFSEPILRRVARHATLGLHHLHSDCHELHRDIKPANLLMNRTWDVKIADFGIVANLDSTDANCQTFVGTSVYMSPERIRGERYSYSSDVWSLGLSLVMCATGETPYNVEKGFFGLAQQIMQNPSPTLPSGFSNEAQDFVEKCLLKNPYERWTTTELLQHPFLTQPDDELPIYEPPYVREGRDTVSHEEGEEVSLLAESLVPKLYPNNVPGGKLYRGSLFDLATFERIALEVEAPTRSIQREFEKRLNTWER